jgi:hypothetical protein
MLTKYSIKTASSVVKRTDWSYFGAESLFAKLRVLKTCVGFFAYLIVSSFKYFGRCIRILIDINLVGVLYLASAKEDRSS